MVEDEPAPGPRQSRNSRCQTPHFRPGELIYIDVDGASYQGYKSCVYRTYCVGGEPTDEHQQYYDLASKWLWDSIEATKPG